MKKLMLSTVMASLLLTGCATMRDSVLPVVFITAGAISDLTTPKKPDECIHFSKIKGSKIFNCNLQYNYGIAESKKDKSLALIDKDGNILIPYGKFEYFSEIKPNYFETYQDKNINNINKRGVVDRAGKIIVPLKYIHIIDYKEYFCGDNNHYESYHPKGKDCYDRDGNLVHGLSSKNDVFTKDGLVSKDDINTNK